jgi:RNA polymerase sigma-70 factor (ECF subfamily)
VSEAAEALSQYGRLEAAQLVATLTRELGNFDLAEEAVQDAMVEAVQHWPVSGVPREPGAWLRVVAQRKAIGRLRRETRFRARAHLLGTLETSAADADAHVADDRLILLFMCCHPTLSREAQVALMLRSLLGLTTAQLAKAFLTSEATMTQRIVRAKRKLVEAGIPFVLPPGDEAITRLGEVLTSVYLLFNEGYLSAGPAAAQRRDLADDAEWLATLLLQVLPEEPEVIGLLALIRLQQARHLARFDPAGGLVLLRDQDRSLWDRAAIDSALTLLNRALRVGRPGIYQVQAAIAACHATARRWEDTDWSLIVRLYDQLLTLTHSPVAALNRAIVLLYRDGPEAGFAALDGLADRLQIYHLYHATRAHMLRALDRHTEAAAADRQAAARTTNPAELMLLQHRMAGLPALAGDNY